MVKSIQEILNNFAYKKNNWKLLLLKNWDHIIGRLKNQVKIEKISGEAITLGVYNSSWMQELYLLSNVLLKKINSQLDKPRLKKIIFKKTACKKIKKRITRQLDDGNDLKIYLSDKEKKSLECISDNELKVLLQAFLIRCNRSKK